MYFSVGFGTTKKKVNQPLKDEHGHGFMESTGRNLFVGIVFQCGQMEFSIGPFEIWRRKLCISL